MKIRAAKSRNLNIHEHLEFVVKNTTYADRWRWLKEANAFVQEVERRRKRGTLFVKKGTH